MSVNVLKKTYSFEELFDSKAKTKIIRLLALEGELIISQIIKRSKLNHATVIRHLEFLKGIDIVQEKNFGKIRIFRFKSENVKAKAIRTLICLIEGI